MKKILYLSGLQIFPPESGGQLRSASLSTGLADLISPDARVEIFSFTGRKKDSLREKKSFSQSQAPRLIEYVNLSPLWGFFQLLCYRLGLPPLGTYLFLYLGRF